MTWLVHTTRHWTDGQFAYLIIALTLAAETVLVAAAHWATTRLLAHRSRRHHPTRVYIDLDGRHRRRNQP